MDINATLLVEVIIFLGFILLSMEYVWPPILAVLEERRALVAHGLQNADYAAQCLAEAREQKEKLILEGKQQAQAILSNAHQEESAIKEEAEQVIANKHTEWQATTTAQLELQRVNTAKALQDDMASLCIKICQKTLASNTLPKEIEQALLENLAQEHSS